MGVSRQCFSKPAPWVVAKRVRERQLGYRAVQVLAFIKGRLENGQPPPSYRDICEQFDMQKGNVHRLIVSLEKRGDVTRNSRDVWRAPIVKLAR